MMRHIAQWVLSVALLTPAVLSAQGGIYVESSGNVGVGVSDPTVELDVSGDTSVDGNISATGSVDADGVITADLGTAYSASLSGVSLDFERVNSYIRNYGEGAQGNLIVQLSDSSSVLTTRFTMSGSNGAITVQSLSGSGSGQHVCVDNNGTMSICSSTLRHKTDVQPLSKAGMGVVRQLRPVSYLRKGDSTGQREYGFIAEEVDRFAPEMVFRNNEGQIEGLRYQSVTVALTKAIQELEARVEAMAQELDTLKKRNKS